MSTGKKETAAIEAMEPDTTKVAAENPSFVKRIGSTTYTVNVHFSTTSKER